MWRESVWSWAFRLAVGVCAPLVVGYFQGNVSDMFWTALAAQSLGLIELRGNFGNVVRVLLLGSIFSIGTCILGSVTGHILWLHVVVIFFVGFLSTLFKNLGERGVGMALSFYMIFFLSSSIPVQNTEEVIHRVQLVGMGQVWAIILAVLWMMVEKQGRPLRRTLAEVFYEMSVMTTKARSGFGAEGLFTSLRELFLQENKVRSALNVSIELFSSNDKENYNKEVAEQIRKIAGLLNIQLLEIIEISRQLIPLRKQENSGVHVHTILRIWEQIFQLSDVYIEHLKPEDKLLLQTRIERLADITEAIEGQDFSDPKIAEHLAQILHLSKRMSKLASRAIDILEEYREKRTFQVYTFSRTLSILHPRLFGNELANFFRFEKSTTAYALRVGIGAVIGTLIDHFFFNHHGYWVPLTTIIVAQPFIGATLKRGIERVIGTFLGILVGYFFFEFVRIPELNIPLVFASTVMVIYFLKKTYLWATLFVTLSLIGLVSVSQGGGEEILGVRILATLVGASISIATGFLFMSTWDAEMISLHFKKALHKNFDYWLSAPIWHNKLSNWLRYKRISESANASLYQSFTRWIAEPGVNKDRKEVGRYFARIAHVIRITKEINNINLEWEMQQDHSQTEPYDVSDVNKLFEEIMILMSIEFDIPEEQLPDSVALNENQKLSVDKLLLELRALKHSLEHRSGELQTASPIA